MSPPVDDYISSSSPSSSSEDYSYNDSADAGPQLHFLSNKILVFAIIALFWVIVLLTSLHIYGRWLRMSRNRNSNAIHSPNQDQQSPSANGLSKAVIAQLPTFTYTAPAISDPGTAENAGLTLECAVCLSEFQENEKGRLLPCCKHSFHIECIDMWFYSHSTCPLCRAKVMMPTITTSPLMPITVNTIEQQQEGGEEAPQEAHIAIETTPYAHYDTASAIPDGSDLAHAVQIPTNVLFCGNSTQLLTSQLGSSQSSERPSPSSSAKTTRCIPHITIEIPTCQDINLPSPGCLSLTSRRSRCASPHDVGCSSRTPLKSPGLRESLKRMLNGQSSEGKRVFTSCNQEGSMDDGISKGDSKIAG